MDVQTQDNKPTSRHRSPTFSKEEVKELVNLIDKYKHTIMNKSSSVVACNSKEAAWANIARTFNSRGFEHVRTADSLKVKWENLKKDIRKISKNILDPQHTDFNPLNAQIMAILCEAENSSVIDSVVVEAPPDLNDEIEDNSLSEKKDSAHNSDIYWDEGVEKQSQDDSVGEDAERTVRVRTINFSPKECNLLLQCVRREKQHVFNKCVTSRAIKLKNIAWSRITDSYNKLSPQKRSTKMLRNKFRNMKKMARQVGFKEYVKSFGTSKHEKLVEESTKKIKKEPDLGYEMDEESDCNDNNDEDDFISQKTENNNFNITLDPLCSVLNGDSGIGSTHMGTLNHPENQDLMKLKMDLLNYQMETAKLERKRLEDLLHEDAQTRSSRAAETALRLRAARLEAVAAEVKLPPAHPALTYTPEEASAQQYLGQYHHT